MGMYALGYWDFYDKNGNKTLLILSSAPAGSTGFFEGSLNGIVIAGHWNQNTNEIAWAMEPRISRTGGLTLNPSPFYKGTGIAIKNPIELMTGLSDPSETQIFLAQRLGLPTPTPQPWVAIYQGPIIG